MRRAVLLGSALNLLACGPAIDPGVDADSSAEGSGSGGGEGGSEATGETDSAPASPRGAVEEAVYCGELSADELVVYVPVDDGCLRLYLEITYDPSFTVESGWGERVGADCHAMDEPFETFVEVSASGYTGHGGLWLTGEGLGEDGASTPFDIAATSGAWSEPPVCD